MCKLKIHFMCFNIKFELRSRNLIFTLQKYQSNELVFTGTHS